MTPKGGLPAIVNLEPVLGMVVPSFDYGNHWRKLIDYQSGDIITDDDILHDLHNKFADRLSYGSVTVYKLYAGNPARNHRICFTASTHSPYKILVSTETNVDCVLYLTRTVMDHRRLWQGHPYFVNGYHDFYVERPILTEAVVLVFDCDKRLRDLIEDAQSRTI